MKHIHRPLSLLLTLLMSLTLLSGCSGKREDAVVLASETETADADGAGSDDIVTRFSGKRVAVTTGSIFDQTAEKYLPDSIVAYINSSTDIALSLEVGKIDAYIADEPVARMLTADYPKQYILTTLEPASYAYLYPKEKEKSDTLRLQMNELLKKYRADGTLAEIDALWFGDDTENKDIKYEELTGENGTLNFAVSSDVGAPFVYMLNGEYVGYDVDIAVRFCKEYGYGINIVDTNISGFLASVSGGRCDFGASTVAITEERKEIFDFSEPNYDGGIVLVTRDRTQNDTPILSDPSLLEKLAGCTVGVVTGAVHDVLAGQYLPDSHVLQLSTTADLPIALEAGKIDAYYVDQPLARILMKNYPDHSIYAVTSLDNYGYLFPKNNQLADKLLAQMNGFIKKISADGTLEEISNIWFGDDDSLKVVDYSSLTGENGEIRLAVSTSAGDPFCYLKDGKYAGYDVDIAVRFCSEYGYSIRIDNYDVAGLIAAISAGKSDFGASCITITEERRESVNFSEPNYYGGSVLVIKGSTISPKISGADTLWFAVQNTLRGIADSFYKTFIRENRWQLFANGIATTILITVLSVIFGTAGGFAFYLLYRKNHRAFNRFTDITSDILGKTPMVVILMILYYIIFGSSDIDGMWVSVFGFSLIFACTVTRLTGVAVGAVDLGQMEASLALGYTETHAFVKIIFPQALRHFLPVYKGEIVALVKGTAVVGYIAVQDLTKVSDIIRSRTYEAFFPLIASAVIYVFIAWLFTTAVSRIQLSSDPKRRRKETILKGVNAK